MTISYLIPSPNFSDLGNKSSHSLQVTYQLTNRARTEDFAKATDISQLDVEEPAPQPLPQINDYSTVGILQHVGR